jgi:CelD/BcsL family acetyltransferase involved in cellulose biosynthesis
MQTLVNHATATLPVSTQGIEVLIGEEVFDELSDEGFQRGWDELYEACPWGTVFQSRGFVACWYRTYRHDYLPVLLRGGGEGRLTGLLALALPLGGGGRLVGAGHFEAEYQCWLTAEAEGESFITAALAALQERLPGHALHLRFLPPGAPLAWATADPHWRAQCVLEPARRPLMDMADPQLPKLLKLSGQNKSKLNRLRRLGEVRLERVTDAAAFSAMLGELAVQYDFRQGALFNKNRFREDPLKAVFLQELFRLGLLHATVLKVNEEVIAAMVAVSGQNWVHLQGLNIHSPLYARHSPGILHFFMLGKMLADEGAAVFDLTPGGDPYKERFATRHDVVHTLTIAANPSIRRKKQIRKIIQAYLTQAGMRPMSVELGIKRKIYTIRKALLSAKEIGLIKTLSDQVKATWYAKFPKAYLIKLPQDPKTQTTIRKDSLTDLLDFKSKGTSLTRWDFLEDAMRRLEAGEHSFTLARGGRLLACAWLRAPKAGAMAGRFTLPEGAAALHGIYCHPDHIDEFDSFVSATAQSISTELNIDKVYAIADNRFAELIQHTAFSAPYVQT